MVVIVLVLMFAAAASLRLIRFSALERYFDYYNNRRPHRMLDYKTPAEVYFGDMKSAASCLSAAAILRSACVVAHSHASAGPSKTQLCATQLNRGKALQPLSYATEMLVENGWGCRCLCSRKFLWQWSA